MNDEPKASYYGRDGEMPQHQVPAHPVEEIHVAPSDETFDLGGQPVVRDDALRSDRAKGTLVRFFNLIMSLAVIGACLFVGAIWYGVQSFDAPGPLKEKTTFTVPKGATFNRIIPQLEKAGIIPRQGPLRVFSRGVQTSGYGSKLKAGEFGFRPGMTMRQVMLELTEGRAIEYTLTFPEGWTSYQIMERITFDETLKGPVPVLPLEGSLLPNTYSFDRETTREKLVIRMQEAQKKALKEIWESRVEGLPLKSPEEMVILASIVEKETGVSSERPHVASVFINRLRKGMRLETDPTIIYGLFGGKGKPKGRPIYRSDLRKATPYNTYQIQGLPPTPIANPGLASMRAVANPLVTEDFFFVADGTGGHAFAKTLKQHNTNVAKWRKIEAQSKRDAAAKAAEELKTE